jgi:hypothetical protein
VVIILRFTFLKYGRGSILSPTGKYLKGNTLSKIKILGLNPPDAAAFSLMKKQGNAHAR